VGWLTLEFPEELNRIRVVELEGIVQETPTVKTFIFKDQLASKGVPGQFVMVWIPGVDEIPMSLSRMGEDGECSITVARIGEATAALHSMRTGDEIGVRGPYGNGFTPVSGKVLVAGGGTGAAPLLPLIEALTSLDAEVTLILGAKTKEELLFLKRAESLLKASGGELKIVTEDGSLGDKGQVSDTVKRLLAEDSYDMIYTCGPEKMMWKIVKLGIRFKVRVQASLERYMRCGMGICGSCCIGPFRVCRDGPVFTTEQLQKVAKEFGFIRREPTGEWTPI